MRYTDYCQQLFGHRMQKLAVNAGFSCPNRDGTLGTTGCTFCNNDAFSPSYCKPTKSITQQIDEGIRFHARRHRRPVGYMAYFQSYSNTYAPLPLLRERYIEALTHPRVEGLVVATRPDCVDEAKLDLLASLAREHYIMVEYGIESCYDRTLERIRRGHNYACTVRAIEETARHGIPCGGHLILGLPGESRGEIVAEATLLSQLPLTTLKLHQLQILRGSQMWQDRLCPASALPPPFALDEYIALVCDFLERLRPDIVVERYAASVPSRYQAAPERRWLFPDGSPVKAGDIAQRVNAELMRRGSQQGIFYNPPNTLQR
ncbi:MAG: TIGR01212 family radical SAM protein [Bacteroidales bacterium]|nr:TIGR01212 family radical SAM protein [Bacteroidales bacterium]